MSRRLLIHVGYHKTATTWMQRRLFAPAHGFAQAAGHREVFELLTRPHGLGFDPAPFARVVEARIAAAPAEACPVVSSEILSGHPFFGGWGSDEYARRLKQAVPDARILVSIRAQLAILPSVYMQYVRRGGVEPYDVFFAPRPRLDRRAFEPEHFEYDRLVGLYHRLFGRENVLVVTQEAIAADPGGAAARIAAFAGASAFAGLSAEAARPDAVGDPEAAAFLLRRINRFRAEAMHPWPALDLGGAARLAYRGVSWAARRPALKGLMRRRPVSAFVRARFAGRYDESNRRLLGLIGDEADLSAYLPG